MPDDSPSAPSPTQPSQRTKSQRASTSSGTVRPRSSPAPGSSSEQNGDGRPPTKRARKAINCEPCRNSKLKCDRNRPCSSCVLRGTSASCYQDARGQEGSDATSRGDDHHFNRVDPAQEIARLRHSISLLESYIFPQRNSAVQHRRPSDASSLVPKKEAVESDIGDKNTAAPGMLGTQGHGGLYAGPTSIAMHLVPTDSRGSEDSDSRPENPEHPEDVDRDYDRDLLAIVPSLDIVDGLIAYYFEYCNWIYRHVNHSGFIQQWERFKKGTSADRIVFATACAIMAVATFYLPQHHQLLEAFSEGHEELGKKFYEISGVALQRRNAETRTYTIELVELLLIRGHYQTLSKNDSEEIWHIRGELVTIGMAMGLHRDPGKWRMPRDVAERRRWAWWHIVLMERWQAFMFGRPLVIASHHFDTQLPSYCDPAIDKTGRLYLPNIALFQLAFILGDIMDDAISVRPVPYESVQANDRALTRWMESLPQELDLDDYRIARSLASPNVAIRRLGVQSVIIRSSYYHIRFTLHRPYASNPSTSSGLNSKTVVDQTKSAQSLEIAVSAADKLITMVGQSNPDFLANSSLAVPGHMRWGPLHCFSAAMFFSFQLIANPDQPGAGLFRANIRKTMSTLEQSRGMPIADKGYDILQALAPLYSAEFPNSSSETREKLRAQVLGTVRKLAFPYHDNQDPRRYGEASNGRANANSPSNSNSVSPPMAVMKGLPPQPYDYIPAASTTVRAMPPGYPIPSPHQNHLTQSPQQGQLSPSVMAHSQAVVNSSSAPYQSTQYPMQQQPMYPDTSRYTQYVHPVEDATMWGAAVGFGQGEWTQFLDGFRPDTATAARHMPTS